MVKKVCEKSLKDYKLPRGRNGFDVGLELGAACRVTLGHVKTGELKINANDNYALAA
jgi:hypothetical protein